MAGEVTHATQTAEIGEVPRHWLVAPLSAFVSRVTYGFTNPMPTTDSGPFMVTAKDVHGGRIDYSTARHTSWDAYRHKLTDKSRPRVGDVLLTKDGSIGRVAICDRADVCINQSVALVQPSDNIDSRYLKYLLETPHYQNRMEGDSDGTTIKHIYITRVDKMEVAVPPILEQRAIAHILCTLDDKIELNRRMNETLEAMARGLFNSWFVDFDPIRANAEGRDPGLPKPIAELFPDRFEYSELGDIPAGWQTLDIYAIANVIYGAPFKSALFNEDSFGRPLIRIRDLATHDPCVFTPEHPPRGYLVQPGDLIVGMDGEFRAHLWRGPEAWLNQRLCLFQPRSGVPGAFVHYSIERLLAFFERSKSGTTVIHLGKSDIDTFRVIVPPNEILDHFGIVVEPLDARIVIAAQEARNLAALRDTLLPRLMSGEVRVPQAERILERTT